MAEEVARNLQQHGAGLSTDVDGSAGAPLVALSLQLPVPGSLQTGNAAAAGWVMGANVVTRDRMAPLHGLVESLNAMNSPALAQAYRQALVGAGKPADGDAPGFGLLTLAREASAPLQMQCSTDAATQAWAPAYLVVKVQV